MRSATASGPRIVRGGGAVRATGRAAKKVRAAPVPVLPRTVLGLELLLAAGPLDLRAAGRLLRQDPGALLHVYRLLAEECPVAEGRPERLEECLAGLPVQRLLRRLLRASEGVVEPESLEQFARHAAEIGRGAESVAETLGLGREQAWAVGMLHELGQLPRLGGRLRQERSAVQEGMAHRCAELARQYRLPSTLCGALDEVHREGAGSIWRAVVAAAHELPQAAGAC